MKITADGNPDKEKIGPLGMGFFSVFSVTDTPLVTSAGEQMELYWGSGSEEDQVRNSL